ncbi:MAG: precorrin-6A reductase, partial [Fretibacterium sp.]|nr:precorrin-6A reductase [Fretibacterium sp.]
MSRLLLFGGTTEAREILEKVPALCCVATEYGAELVRDLPGVEARAGRLDAEGMAALIRTEDVACVIDATHPYAAEVTRNIKAACERTGVPLLRVSRGPVAAPCDGVVAAGSCREAAELLNHREGNVLLTVGSKELREFTAVRDYRQRLFVRVLPASDVLCACEELGFDPAHIIAMQGPFSRAMNLTMLEDIRAAVLVTKDGGTAGGIEAKLDAAREAGAEVILIARPDDSGGHTVEEGILWARRKLGLSRPPLFPMLLDLEGRRVLVAGGGNVALRRTTTLLKCGARVRAVSPVFRDDFPREAERLLRPFGPGDLEGAALAVAASDDREVNRQVGREARARGIPVSVADAAAEGSFFFPALIVSEGAAVSVS